jgi:hypothetical protein
MAMLIVLHKVRDFRKWRRAYDAHGPARRRAGLGAAQVYRGVGDTHKVAIVFRVKNIHKAKAFVESDDLRKAMKGAGKPTFTFSDADARSPSQRGTPSRTTKYNPNDRPAEATADAWARFRQAVNAMQRGRPKPKTTAKPKNTRATKASRSR